MVYENRNFGVTNSTVTIEGVRSQCPRCGRQANIIDGTYAVYRETVSAIGAGPALTNKIDALNELFKAFKSKRSLTDDIIEAADLVDERLGKAARMLKEKRYGPLLFGLLLIGVIKACDASDGDSERPVIINNYYMHEYTRPEDTVLFYPHDPKFLKRT